MRSGNSRYLCRPKLLTFLDTRQFTRVGGEKNITVNARLIAATNRDLEQEVESGRFRQDLFYRLNVLSVTVPPLRERREDIPILIRQMMTRLCKDMQVPEIPPSTREQSTLSRVMTGRKKRARTPQCLGEGSDALRREVYKSCGSWTGHGQWDFQGLVASCVFPTRNP